MQSFGQTNRLLLFVPSVCHPQVTYADYLPLSKVCNEPNAEQNLCQYLTQNAELVFYTGFLLRK
jgi:hypothetical protein